MSGSSAEYACQSNTERNSHFSRRWIEPAWLPDHSTSRLNGQRVRPIDAMIRHSADSSRHVLTGRALEGQR